MAKMHQKIARERIDILFSEAERRYHENPDLSKRYIHIARKVGMKCNVSIPRRLKMRFCKKCGAYLVPGSSSRVRIDSQKKNVVITCLRCGFSRRYPYK
ncbi:MAG: ribonuclease P [Candidatus Micrarchaeota archaeon]|nr:ribonuclease P [Candidatus Micrarchaeota archaeon]